MKAEKITMKATACRNIEEFKEGTEYRVLFSDIPDYAKKEWLEEAERICLDAEKRSPMLEMQAVLMPNGNMHDIIIQYYFDDYIEFSLKSEDKEVMCILFRKFCISHGDEYPDAYDPKKDTILGDAEWQALADQRLRAITEKPSPFGSLLVDGFIVGESIRELLKDERMWKAGYLLEHMSIGCTVSGNELHWKLVSVKPRRLICTDLRFDGVLKEEIQNVIGRQFGIDGTSWSLDIPHKKELDKTIFSNPQPGEVCNYSDINAEEWNYFVPVIEMLTTPSEIYFGSMFTFSDLPITLPTTVIPSMKGHIKLDFNNRYLEPWTIHWLAVDDCFISDRPLIYTNKENLVDVLDMKVNLFGVDHVIKQASDAVYQKAKSMYYLRFRENESFENYGKETGICFRPVLVPITN